MYTKVVIRHPVEEPLSARRCRPGRFLPARVFPSDRYRNARRLRRLNDVARCQRLLRSAPGVYASYLTVLAPQGRKARYEYHRLEVAS